MLRFFFFLGVVFAETIIFDNSGSPSCNLEDVQMAVDQASDGDTIVLAAKDCTWSGQLNVDMTSGSPRSLHIRGYGMDKTTIRVSGTAISFISSQGKAWSLSDLEIIDDNSQDIWTGVISVGGSGDGWRIHDIRLVVNEGSTKYIRVYGRTYGLIDHNEFVGTRAATIHIGGDNWDGYFREHNFGDSNAAFIENNLFKTDPLNSAVAYGATDCDSAGRYVFRFNTIHNTIAQCHGFDSGGIASCMSMEVYGNKGYMNDVDAWTWLGQVRGGSVLWFGNTWEIGENVWLNQGVALRVYRTSNGYGWGLCDGTEYRLCSNVDENWDILSGDNPVTCQNDGDCSSTSSTCKWSFCSEGKTFLCDQTNGDADCQQRDGKNWGTCTSFLDDYPNECFQQVGRSTYNLLKPSYEWENSCQGSENLCHGDPGSFNFHFGADDPLVENVDFFNQKDSFDGSEGVGSGVLADRPPTCTEGTAYWASDVGDWNKLNTGSDGTLYVCESSDKWVEYYVPYEYPHPLAQSNDVRMSLNILIFAIILLLLQ